MTSLNPVYRIGKQIAEPLRLHKNMSRKEAWAAAVELLAQVGIPQAERPGPRLSARVLGRHAAEGDDRHGAGLRPGHPDRRRADHRAGRDHPGADPGAHGGDPGAHQVGHHHDHARPGRGGRHGRPRAGHVRRQGGGVRHGGRGVLRPAASLHLGTAREPAAARRRREGHAVSDQGPAAQPHQSARVGARFSPRCAYAKDICRRRRHRLVEVESGHLSACHLLRGQGVPGPVLALLGGERARWRHCYRSRV